MCSHLIFILQTSQVFYRSIGDIKFGYTAAFSVGFTVHLSFLRHSNACPGVLRELTITIIQHYDSNNWRPLQIKRSYFFH